MASRPSDCRRRQGGCHRKLPAAPSHVEKGKAVDKLEKRMKPDQQNIRAEAGSPHQQIERAPRDSTLRTAMPS